MLATLNLRTTQGTTPLIIGLDLGRVIRVVHGSSIGELPQRARDQIAFHGTKRAEFWLIADELYLFDVQAVERLPDTPGADDPLYLYGMMRGPYPAALQQGVVPVEGQLSTTRGPLLDGLGLGIQRSFVYERGAHGSRCAHATLPANQDDSAPRAVVLAFPLVPMGEDATNELVAAQMIHDVLGAMRTDLGDDLAADPIPVPNRQRYERDLVGAGWKIEGDLAIHRDGKGRLASLFSPARKQRLPREATLDDYVSLIATQVARLPGWPSPARNALHRRLGIVDSTVAAEPTPPEPAKRCPFCSNLTRTVMCDACGQAFPTSAPPSAISSLEAGLAALVLPQPPQPQRSRTPTQPTPPPPPSPPPAAARSRTPTSPPPPAARSRTPTQPTPPPPPGPPPAAKGQSQSKKGKKNKGNRNQQPPAYSSAAPSRPGRNVQNPQRSAGPRTVVRSLTSDAPPAAPPRTNWIKEFVDEHVQPDRPAPRVTTPARTAGGIVPEWMFDLIEQEFPDGDK